MRLALMIEGQEGVTWEDWLALAGACEEHGIETMFRSDHYLSGADPEGRPSTDAWTLLGALAARTERLRLGALVSPVTFRHPAVLAKAVVTADHVSGGRVELGLGTGWMDAEHEVYGIPFPPMKIRLGLLAGQLETVHRHWTEEPRIQPKPVQQPHPPLLVGGSGLSGTIEPAARFADEYNTVMASPAECAERREKLARACEREGREPIPLSVMTGCTIGADEHEARDRVRRRLERSSQQIDPDTYVRDRGDRLILGTVEQAAERLRAFEQAGVERVMLQHLDHTDLDMVALIGRELVPAVA
jgi:alkanesulfonate monooxygenase SsuD/methylene tetrahydromethanopterin reductase-like flavin-dependent oxidoreductase (luciferase family)